MKLNLRTFGLSAVAAAVLVAAAVVVVSQQPGPPPGGPMGRGPIGAGPMGPGPMGPGPMVPGGPGFRGGPQGAGGPRQGFGPFGPFGRELNLTEDQKAQIQKIQESFRESDKALFDQMRALHEKQGDVAPGTFDEAAVRSAAEARAKIQIELEVSHAKMMSQVFSVLSAEQKAQLQAHHDQMKRMGPPPPPPQPPDEQPF